ncbi:hypothetical protein LCGC14_0904260 [marine sediment metagenome]|uniref:Uncharacterized protein n=1 Tax=marine sediment metagenome TaxID=412755 RepID=A0A0F9REJ0_9ZZZZ
MAHQQVTLATFRTALKATWESVPFWSDTEADRAINEALRWWNLFTGYWRKIETIMTVADQVFYSLSSTLILPARVNFSSFPMDIGSVFDLNQGRPNWRGETTTSGAPVPTRPTVWVPIGMKRIAIWPADAVGATTLVVDAIRDTPVLSADADFIDIGREEFSTLTGEALHVAAFKEGGNRWLSTQRFHTEFLRAALARNSMLNASDVFRKAAGIETHRSQYRMRRKEMEPGQETR